MLIGRVFIDLEELRKDYPLSASHIADIQSQNRDSFYYEVTEEDNPYYDAGDNELRVRMHYKHETYGDLSFTIYLLTDYLSYLQPVTS